MNGVLIDVFAATPSGMANPVALNATLVQGERVVVLGPDLGLLSHYMKMLAALEPPQDGQVKVMGLDSASIKSAERRDMRRQLSYVVEGGALLSVVNGPLNLMLAARYHRIGDEKSLTARANELLAELPDREQHGHLPAFMSERLRRLLAIARPLMLEPIALFAENPFLGLSHADRLLVGEYLCSIHGRHLSTLVVSTDDLLFTRQFGQKILYCDGKHALLMESWAALQACKLDSLEHMFNQQNLTRHERH